MFFGRKTEKLSGFFRFTRKVSFFSKTYEFPLTVANHESNNSGLSSIKKVFLFKGTFSGAGLGILFKELIPNPLLIQNSLIYG